MKRLLSTVSVLMCSLLFAMPVISEEKAIDPEALEIFKRVSKKLAQADHLTVNYQATYDAVQESGQIIEFGEQHSLSLVRPGWFRDDIKLSDGSHQQVIFDGKTVNIFNPGENAYAQLEKQGSVDEVLRYLVRDLRFRLPLAQLFVTSLTADMERRLRSLAYVEENQLTEIPTAHIAGSNEDVDFQFWIPTEGDPLPQRIVITYKHAVGQPQFRVVFSGWDLKTPASENYFSFNPPADAEKLPYIVRVREQSAVPAETGGKE